MIDDCHLMNRCNERRTACRGKIVKGSSEEPAWGEPHNTTLAKRARIIAKEIDVSRLLNCSAKNKIETHHYICVLLPLDLDLCITIPSTHEKVTSKCEVLMTFKTPFS